MANILLIDPNASFRRMMEQILRQQKHEVWGAEEADTAGRALKEQSFDVVAVELVLPGEMTGTELLEWLRDFPAPGDPARIAMCSLASFASQEAYFRAELALDGFLVKPFKPSQLKLVMEHALAAREGRPRTSLKQRFAAPPSGDQVLELTTTDLIPLETNPGLAEAPAPSVAEFESASSEGSISLEDLAPPPTTSDRRAVPRFAVRLPVVVHDGKKPFRAFSENIGRGGIFLSTDRALDRGSSIRVRLELPGDGPGFNEIAAEVMHAAGAAPGVGLEFGEMSAQTAGRLDHFLEELRQPAQQRPFLVVAADSLSAEVEKVAQSFRNEEVRVRRLKSGEDLREIAQSEPPDLMLLELSDTSALDAVSELKSTRATSRIPVGLVDRTNEPQAALVAASAGADRFFVLPDDVPRLVSFSVDVLAASRRRSVRVRFQRPITVFGPAGEEHGASVDLSESGLQVRLANAPPEGTAVEIELPLSDELPALRLPATVTWIADAKDGAVLARKVGLLVDPSEEARARIREEVRKALNVGYYVRWLASAPRPATAKTSARSNA